jgi:hypothetical protein
MVTIYRPPCPSRSLPYSRRVRPPSFAVVIASAVDHLASPSKLSLYPSQRKVRSARAGSPYRHCLPIAVLPLQQTAEGKKPLTRQALALLQRDSRVRFYALLRWSSLCPQHRRPRPAGVRSPVEIKKSKSRAGGTAGAAVHPKTTDPTSWEIELPW